ncbi:13689_t:CDS:2, partial [Cetraspora pellucida]
MSLAGAINIGKYNKKGELEYDHDKFSIHNFRKTNETLKDERERREKKQTKRLDNAIKNITGLNLNDSECDDEDSDDEMN